MFLRQADFVDRNNFAAFLNRRGLAGSAAEVGTHRADFARIFIRNWEGKMLHCIDPWANPPGYESQAVDLAGSSGDRQADFLHAKMALRRYQPRTTLWQRTSVGAGAAFGRASLDFVYLDGDHRLEMVAQDLNIWWPKVRPGGILAGHDFVCHEPDGGWSRHVQPAVLSFAQIHGLDVWLVTETLCLPWSFYLEKPR